MPPLTRCFGELRCLGSFSVCFFWVFLCMFSFDTELFTSLSRPFPQDTEMISQLLVGKKQRQQRLSRTEVAQRAQYETGGCVCDLSWSLSIKKTCELKNLSPMSEEPGASLVQENISSDWVGITINLFLGRFNFVSFKKIQSTCLKSDVFSQLFIGFEALMQENVPKVKQSLKKYNNNNNKIEGWLFFLSGPISGLHRSGLARGTRVWGVKGRSCQHVGRF